MILTPTGSGEHLSRSHMNTGSKSHQGKVLPGVKCLLCKQQRGSSLCARIPYARKDLDPAKPTQYRYHVSYPDSEKYGDRQQKRGTGDKACVYDVRQYRRDFLKACGLTGRVAVTDALDNDRTFVHKSCLLERMSEEAKRFGGWFDTSSTRTVNPTLYIFPKANNFTEKHVQSGMPMVASAVFEARTQEAPPPSVSRMTTEERKMKVALSKVHELIQSQVLSKAARSNGKRICVKEFVKQFGAVWDGLQAASDETISESREYREQKHKETAMHKVEVDAEKKKLLQLQAENRELCEELERLRKLLKTHELDMDRPMTFEREEARWKKHRELERQTGKKTGATQRFHALTGVGDPESLRLFYDIASCVVRPPNGVALGASKSKTGKGRPISLSPHDQLFLFLFLLQTGCKFRVAGAKRRSCARGSVTWLIPPIGTSKPRRVARNKQ